MKQQQYVIRTEKIPVQFPPQHQPFHPGFEYLMVPRPISESSTYKAAGKLQGKVAIISGGDSGIGRAVAYAFAKEGANIVIAYLNEHMDALETKQRVEQLGQRCLVIAGDLGQEKTSHQVVQQTLYAFGKVDIIVNNCAESFPKERITEITGEQLLRIFQSNVFSFFYLTKAALPYLKQGGSIINTGSASAYEGQQGNLDYATSKGAIITFTRSLALDLINDGIRVNGVSPGPIWTPIIPSSFPAEQMMSFGYGTPMKRAGQPYELAPAYVYLASDDSSYVTGQIIHVNGGMRTSS
ncbi:MULTISPECIES: SDR family oxidoreductase [unclassified Bacillus (in: firmicutes)]|uniref:SDR family oxidoreductase n=1 Tax=unclassified Bacillus (in: firmicutes) TaxID=185979 RepID=UPI0008E809DD|nr:MULTISPECIES: SDR family oxidoreductase [unclassified Bacillus (in: firmicutes)]SFH96427.1 NAD(P)-dependent dehydrogenase, short-chain alcohol dehydrogenase family [Bacillus sp. 71mf]SFS94700.1 NAD(P)-dependent dehydrogenase, short-chain alcohol dehydrogenase family [Bacillus sp. 103mf]